jgi:hypothetical protein
MVVDWHCIFRKAEFGSGGWVKRSHHAVEESIISAFGITQNLKLPLPPRQAS